MNHFYEQIWGNWSFRMTHLDSCTKAQKSEKDGDAALGSNSYLFSILDHL